MVAGSEMHIINLLKCLKSVERIAGYSKVRRFLNHPVKYMLAQLYIRFPSALIGKQKFVSTKLFFCTRMKIALPAATDIYLTGGKSHSSEIRLAKFMIRNVRPADHFLDIGAHYGYFSILASELVGQFGIVQSFEPSQQSFALLQDNVSLLSNVVGFNKAVSSTSGTTSFYEFPTSHSEYNTIDIRQFSDTSWFRQSKPIEVLVESTTIDGIVDLESFTPRFIKLDVEGSEYQALLGGLSFLHDFSPFLIMEYLEPKRNNRSHRNAVQLLLSLSYQSFIVTDRGTLQMIVDIDNYLIDANLESDNIVFAKNISTSHRAFS
jgi:FkbM family methyltransferase